MEACAKLILEQGDLEWGAYQTGNVSELYLTLGDVKEAVEYGRQAVEYADKSKVEFQRMAMRTTLADALHQAGENSKAEELFREAEEMQREDEEYEYLYSVQGYQFCDLLLGQGKYGEVKKRAEKTLGWVMQQGFLLDIGLDNLSLGRAHMVEAVVEGTKDFGKAREYLDVAVEGLRKAGTQDNLPRGLLARAELNRLCREFKDARRDVEEAQETAERGEMKLFMADCALEACRLNLAEGKRKEAEVELEKARDLIEECGYHRRDRDLKSIINEL